MKPECHHPPFVLNIDQRTTPRTLEAMLQDALQRPTMPIVIDGATGYVEVIECSWCRNPNEVLLAPSEDTPEG